jgi:hypothetical protein
MVGKDFWKGAEESPYCNIRLRRSFLPLKVRPPSSAISLSSQLAAEKSSETDCTDEEVGDADI